MLVETVLSMQDAKYCHFEEVIIEAGPIFRRAWPSPWRPSMCLAVCQWHGFQPTASGFVPLSILAEFSL